MNVNRPLKTAECPHLTIIEIYRSPNLALSSLLAAIRAILQENRSLNVIVTTDFNVNWLDVVARTKIVVQSYYQ